MLDAVVTVVAPSRLHFGLLSFGQPSRRAYGGVGVMIDSPHLEVRAVPHAKFETEGPLAERALEFAHRWSASYNLKQPPNCLLQVREAPPEHVGLGVGTQLGLAVAQALQSLCEMPEISVANLAQRVGRGRRSAIGTYGFARGGLLVDAGQAAGEEIAPPAERRELCRDWRFVLLRLPRAAGLFGDLEQKAFERLPPVPLAVSDALHEELHARLLPAAAAQRFDDFGESLYQYGRLAGECFAAVQGGPYNGPRLERFVNLLRSWGILGVGQSSWGPTLFALTRNSAEASDLVQRLAPYAAEGLETIVAAPNARGAEVRIG